MSKTLVGLIFAAFSVSMSLVSPLMTSLIGRYGRRRLIVSGGIYQGIVLNLMAFSVYIDNKYVFIGSAFILRILQGICYTFVCVSCWSVATVFYEDLKERFLGL